MASLRIVATPIGNLEDLSFRALRILKESDYVLCEDTRVTRRLLDHYGLKTPTVSYHQHSGAPKTEKLLALLAEGKDLALVTDAGTPGVSDPGSALVSAARERFGDDIKIESIPGPSALATALALAGVGFDHFLFLGFLPHKKGRQTLIRKMSESGYPAVLYESKHRILKLLQELTSDPELSKREILIARELTKLHESFYRGRPSELLKRLEDDPVTQKGEFVVLIRNKYAS